MQPEKTILVVEDDAHIRGVIRGALASEGCRLIETDGVAAGMHAFSLNEPDLVVLDIVLPDGSGLDVCKKIRSHKTRPGTPVIMLTGKAGLEDKVSGFEAGADQYLVKPVHPKELLLWVKALLRRLDYDKEQGDELKVGELAIDLKAHLVRYRGELVPQLTVKEFDLLYFLAKKRPQVLSREQILKTLWDTITVDHVVDTHLSNLRRKLPRELADKIQNIPGKGFRFFE